MTPTFGNPAGFLALLAIPAILAIHFLQRESRRVVSSTLFLLEQLAPESAQGRRFERLRTSVPLWLQLLAALLAAWLLVDPRWVRPDAAQHVMLVLDSTVSMDAFRDDLLKALDEDTARLASAAAHTEWQVVETDLTRATIYSGPDRQGPSCRGARMAAAPRRTRSRPANPVRASDPRRQGLADFRDRPQAASPLRRPAARRGPSVRSLRILRRDNRGRQLARPRAQLRRHHSAAELVGRGRRTEIARPRRDAAPRRRGRAQRRIPAGRIAVRTGHGRGRLPARQPPADAHSAIETPRDRASRRTPITRISSSNSSAAWIAPMFLGSAPDLALAVYDPLAPALPPGAGNGLRVRSHAVHHLRAGQCDRGGQFARGGVELVRPARA